jgi:hypothetical protein
MRKAKIALSAIAILAVVGGAFAFKSTRVGHPFFSTVGGLCTSAVNPLYTTDLNDASSPIPIVQTTYYTAPVQGPCPTTTIFRAL